MLCYPTDSRCLYVFRAAAIGPKHPQLINAVTDKVAHSTRMEAFESAKQPTSLRHSVVLADQSAGDLR
jgi:hypothetical protein